MREPWNRSDHRGDWLNFQQSSEDRRWPKYVHLQHPSSTNKANYSVRSNMTINKAGLRLFSYRRMPAPDGMLPLPGRLTWALFPAAALATILGAAGCSSNDPLHAYASGKSSNFAEQAGATLREEGANAFALGKPQSAEVLYTELAGRHPYNASLHTLLALSWHQRSDAEPEALSMAAAGYEVALRAQPGHFWAAAMAGRSALDRGRFGEAVTYFARAVMARPTDGRAMLALASAAYRAGDASLAAVAASRAVELNPEGELRAAAVELAAIAAAANHEAGTARSYLAVLSSLDAEHATVTGRRVEQLVMTSALDDEPASAEKSTALGVSDSGVAAGDQLTVDVAIVLSQNSKQEKLGVNLLDGLSLTYGYGRQETDTHSTATGFDPVDAAQTVITTAIGIPQLSYNLNLFNRRGQFYSVVARPSLTAFRNEVSEFFVGRTLKVAVGGINVTALEQIDIGIEMKVLPYEITETGARLRIEVTRSFLTSDPAGSFAESLTTFRQRVAATAEVRFGETLILSGLSEHVDDSIHSRTPVLGNIPVVNALFSQRSQTNRQDAALVLVTPSRATRLPGRAFVRSGIVDKLTHLWTRVVDPGSNVEAITERLERSVRFLRMSPSDTSFVWPSPLHDQDEILAELNHD